MRSYSKITACPRAPRNGQLGKRASRSTWCDTQSRNVQKRLSLDGKRPSVTVCAPDEFLGVISVAPPPQSHHTVGATAGQHEIAVDLTARDRQHLATMTDAGTPRQFDEHLIPFLPANRPTPAYAAAGLGRAR